MGRLAESPWGLLRALPPLPLVAPLRQAAVHALQAAVQVRVLFREGEGPHESPTISTSVSQGLVALNCCVDVVGCGHGKPEPRMARVWLGLWRPRLSGVSGVCLLPHTRV